MPSPLPTMLPLNQQPMMVPTTGTGIQKRSPDFAQNSGKGGTDANLIDDDFSSYGVKLEPPGFEQLFGKLDSDHALGERIRQEAKNRGSVEPIAFPDPPALTNLKFASRKLPHMGIYAEPYFVVHHRLYFEDLNSERYAWDLGFIQPIVSTAYFFKDVMLFPFHFGAHPHTRFDSSAGKCLPGDPVPYILYPEEITGSGILLEAGTVVAIAMMLP